MLLVITARWHKLLFYSLSVGFPCFLLYCFRLAEDSEGSLFSDFASFRLITSTFLKVDQIRYDHLQQDFAPMHPKVVAESTVVAIGPFVKV